MHLMLCEECNLFISKCIRGYGVREYKRTGYSTCSIANKGTVNLNDFPFMPDYSHTDYHFCSQSCALLWKTKRKELNEREE